VSNARANQSLIAAASAVLFSRLAISWPSSLNSRNRTSRLARHEQIRVKRHRRHRQVAAVGPARAGDPPRVGQLIVHQEAHAVGYIVDGREPLFLVVGVHE